MDKTASVVAALDAGKLPSQQQTNALLDWLLANVLQSDVPEFTHTGRALARDLADVLTAYKQLGTNKNNDNLVQDTLWHLSEADLSAARIEAIDPKEASADMAALRNALRSLLKTLWANIAGEGTQLLGDFASFVRLALADVAESLEAQAATAKERLRTSEGEVQRGERDPLGRKYKAPEDPKRQFEETMDTVKAAGAKAIGAGQAVELTVEERASRTRARLLEAFYQVCDRAQSDEDYKHALDTLFTVASKWLNRTLDTAATADEATLSTFIHDPTDEKHTHRALANIRTLFERLAGGKSLDDVCDKLRVFALDIKQDKDLKVWFDDFIAHVRNGLGTPGYARSPQAEADHDALERRWKALLDRNSEAVQKWNADLEAFRHELRTFQQAIADDADLRCVQEAHARLLEDAEASVAAGGSLGQQFALEQASWFWQDLFNVYTQRVLRVLRSIPIPRTEYVDKEVEFVLENLDISNANLLPGHAYIRNITDIEITAPGATPTKTAFGALTHIRLQAIQLALNEVSFFYRDKTATVGPTDFVGIMQFSLPTQGVDVDFKFRLIPNTEQGLAEREKAKRFFAVERVAVSLAEDIRFEIKESNHPVIASVFKPVLVRRFRDAVARTLEAHIRAAFDFVDAIAFDVAKRSEVFADTGLGPGPSWAAALWSEVGRLRKMEGGVLSGWTATGTGIVREGQEGGPSIAVGAEPQILPGEKRGPLGYGSEPLAERFAEVEAVGARVMEAEREGAARVKTFRESVAHKAAVERKQAGWASTAFDLDAE